MRPSWNGMPVRRAYPTAAGIALSGTGITASAFAGCSSARISPIRSRVAYTDTPPSRLDADARYTCSKMQRPRRVRDDLGVRRGDERHAARGELVAHLARVDAVAVVGDRELAEVVVADDHRLRVLDLRRPRRRVARVAHRRTAAEDREVRLAEHLADETHAADDAQVAAIGR